jgi:hypothetical protein
MAKKEERFFVDIQSGFAAIRDRNEMDLENPEKENVVEILDGTYVKENNSIRLEIDENRLKDLIKKCRDLNKGK